LTRYRPGQRNLTNWFLREEIESWADFLTLRKQWREKYRRFPEKRRVEKRAPERWLDNYARSTPTGMGRKDMYIDLGAEQLLAAEKAERRIAVEIKSFVGVSDMEDLEKALGQYVVYHDVLAEIEPERVLYLAVPRKNPARHFRGAARRTFAAKPPHAPYRI
jgi:hypothetical protein